MDVSLQLEHVYIYFCQIYIYAVQTPRASWPIQRRSHLSAISFKIKVLVVEALTYRSCEKDTIIESYQRLEFLGGAVLDLVLVSLLFEHKLDWSHGDMTAIKNSGSL